MKSEFAQRLDRLGTETAFSVSQDAAEFSSQGNTVYPFHLGDIDIPTPSNIVDAALQAMRDGKTGYNPAAGLPDLRNVLAEVAGRERGLHFQTDNVVIQPGGKPVRVLVNDHAGIEGSIPGRAQSLACEQLHPWARAIGRRGEARVAVSRAVLDFGD